MAREISSSVLAALDDDVVYPFFAVELLFDGDEVIRLWTGQGDLVYQGNTWFGAGTLLEFDTVEETSEIAAKGAVVTLSSVPQEVLALALNEPYQGRKANIYFGMFSKGLLLKEDGDYLLLEQGDKIQLGPQDTAFVEVFTGYMDQMNIDEAGETSTITLTVENKLLTLEKPRTARYTSSYQKYRFPGDKGLDFVDSIQNKPLYWGRST